MTDIANLEAWAKTQGYDPNVNYRSTEPLPEGYLSPHFRESEFACNHCGKLHPDGVPQSLVDALEDIRAHYDNVPVSINSGYRCPTHNANVGGAPASEHLKGRAADFTVKGVDPARVHADLDPYWSGGLGKYNTFTHIDVRGHRARWSG